MKCAVVIADGVKQVMFTPENAAEKFALSMFDVEDEITLEIKQGSFYDSFRDNQARGYNVALCQGGYLRAYEDAESLMVVLKPKPKESPEKSNA